MKNKLTIILAVALIVALAGGGAFYFLVLKNQTPVGPVEEPTYTYALEDYFVTNVKESSKLFKISVVLVLNEDPEKLGTELTDNVYLIRDRINVLLRSKTETDLTASNIEDTLRQEIAATVNEAMGVDYVVSAYFTDFVMQ